MVEEWSGKEEVAYDQPKPMMFEGKHIHFSPVDNKPLCSYSVKLCKQRRLNKYAFCIRHILEDKSAPFKQCAHVARYNNQKCTNPIPSNEDREFCNSHMQVAGMLPKKERKNKKEKERDLFIPSDGKLKFADRLRALLKNDNSITNNEEPFNDDPYAFPDPVTENGSSTAGLGITVARATWNCSQKILDSANCENSLKNELTQFKNSTSVDSRSKSHAPKLSKTMNRLQAKIAENKLLDKLKKSQESSQQTNTTLIGTIKSEPLSPVAAPFPVQASSPKTNLVCGRNKLLNKLLGSSKTICTTDAINKEHSVIPVSDEPEKSSINFLLSSTLHKASIDKSQVTSKHQISKAPSNESSNSSKSMTGMVIVKPRKNKVTVQEIRCTKTPTAIQRIEDIWQSQKKNCKDLYPLAFESSESEGSESEDENHRLHQIQWISIWDRTTSGLHTNNTLTSRALQQCHLKKELGRGYEQLNRIHSLHNQTEDYHITLVQHLTKAAKWYPNRTAHLLLKKLKLVSRPKKIIKSFGVEKNTCCFQHDGVLCNKRSLPYTRHCDKHIMYNVDQLLFEHCTAKFADNTQCCVPVFDICHELPLCPEHAKKRDNYNKMASEPKPKKPRKKSKPSALTRPPKRGKKKKRQNQLRPTPSSSPVVDKILSASQTEVSSSIAVDNTTSEAETRKTNTAVLAKDLGGNLDTELGTDLEEQFSPGTIDKSLELPLDTVELANQATKLLEEHDFTEVLNKIPDDAFSDLFAEARNGEYIPSREETEALERALAAVSKDVHLAKESLAKLSANGPDIDELAGTIDIPSGLLSADNLGGAIDENAFHDLGQGPIDGLGVIPNSLSNSDLNSLSQALSSITSDNLAQSSLPSVTEGHLHHSLASVPVLTSEVAHTQVLNGLTGIHTIPSDAGFGLSSQFIEGSTTVINPVSTQNSVESRYLSNAPSLISSILYGLGQNTTPQPPYPISHLPALNNSNGREEESLVTSTGGPTVANSSTHWLLNPSEQVLALSQMGYQNGFLVTSQAGGTYPGTQQLLTSVGKYPLQALSAEVSLVSSSTPLVTSTCSDSILCGASEESLHNLHISSSATGTLQQTKTATVIVQEGAS